MNPVLILGQVERGRPRAVYGIVFSGVCQGPITCAGSRRDVVFTCPITLVFGQPSNKLRASFSQVVWYFKSFLFYPEHG